MEKTVSLKSLVVEKYTRLLQLAAAKTGLILGKTTPIPVAVRTAPPVRVPVSRRRRRVYP